jgi:hypothetical protein
MQEVDSALATLGSMFFTELVRTSKNVCPLDRSVNKQFLVQTVLNEPKCSTTFQIGDFFATGGVPERIPDFNPVQWREVQRVAGSRDVARRLRSVTIFCHQ